MKFSVVFRISSHEQCNTLLYSNGVLIHSLAVMNSYCLRFLCMATRTIQEDDTIPTNVESMSILMQ